MSLLTAGPYLIEVWLVRPYWVLSMYHIWAVALRLHHGDSRIS
jgi:hypothetical protein